VKIGAQVRAGTTLLPALVRAEEIGADVVQVFTQSPRAWRPTRYSDEVLAAYRAAALVHPSVGATYCHATYLINLAGHDEAMVRRSTDCLHANLAAARGMGALGLVLHIGSHLGRGFPACLSQVVDLLLGALASGTSPQPCPIVLENAAGAGGTVGRSLDELASVLERAGAGTDLGICIDTQHLWASGVAFDTLEAADRLVADISGTVGLERLVCLHVNDSKVALGANRDRHENLGEGTIGEGGLAALLGHPALGELAAILEVPGVGQGPRAEDIATARRLLALGRERRRFR
jgi:deoxyribonuclease-4